MTLLVALGTPVMTQIARLSLAQHAILMCAIAAVCAARVCATMHAAAVMNMLLNDHCNACLDAAPGPTSLLPSALVHMPSAVAVDCYLLLLAVLAPEAAQDSCKQPMYDTPFDHCCHKPSPRLNHQVLPHARHTHLWMPCQTQLA